MANANLNIKITTNASDAGNEIKSFSAEIEKINKPIENFKKALTSWFVPLTTVKNGIDIVVSGIQKYREYLNKLLDAYQPQWEAETKLKTLLQNTNEQLGLNSESLISLAKEFQNCTTYADETIISIESMLVSTNAINKINIKSAVESVLNISTAMGTDAVGSAKTLAEVLKKPSEELNKLKSVGIDFTEEEKEKIKQLTEANRLFEAQELVLKKVESAYGGVAKAMANTPMGAREQLENLKKENEQIKGNIAAIEEDFDVKQKIERQKHKNEGARESLILTKAELNPESLLEEPLEALKKFYEDFKDMELSPYVQERLTIGNVKDAIDKKVNINNDEILNRRGHSEEEYTKLKSSIGVSVEIEGENGESIEDVADDAKTTIEDKLKGIKANIDIASSYLDGIGDVISGWTDFANQLYDNQLNSLNKMLSSMTSSWDEYYGDLKDKQKDESESLIAEYATGRISAEEYYNAKKEMNDEMTKAEEDNKNAKQKAQAQINEIEKKKFIADKANNIANATISMAVGIMNAWTNPITAPIMTALIAATGIAQIATISAQQFTPSFASGAIVNKPTRALVGDSGYPEAIIPLNKADDLGLTSTKRDGEINITVNIENAYTSEDLAKSVYDSISQLKKDGILRKEIL